MAVIYAPETGYAQEMRRWEATHTQFGAPGRPYTYHAFPAMLYKASRGPDGIKVVYDGQIAGNPDEQRNWESRGYVAGGQGAAREALDKTEFSHAELAAERNHEVRRMSEKARTEVEAVEAEHGGRHLPTIPEAPKKRGRKPKGQGQEWS